MSPDTARAWKRPPLTCGMADAAPENIDSTCPAMTSVSARLLPLYGTCSICTLAWRISNAMDRWLLDPTPPEP
ncbi:Uncharacterised protein [Bordetella pertussis]|nr:Uncharacterised protein [Bordetella pertussis]